MATKPASDPRWGNVGGLISPAPSSGLQETGWAPGTKPGNTHFNWLQNMFYQWQQWHKSLLEKLTESAVLSIGPGDFFNDPTNGWDTPGVEEFAHNAATAKSFIVPIRLPLGAKITGVRVRCMVGSATAGVMSARLYALGAVSSGPGGAFTRSDSVGSAASLAAQSQTITLTNVNPSNLVIPTLSPWYVLISTDTTSTDRHVNCVEVTYSIDP